MKNKAINVLLELGTPTNIKGFDYIVEALCLLDEDKTCSTGDLYRKIAFSNNTRSCTVERDIRYAFSKISDNVIFKNQKTINGNLLRILYLRINQKE